MDGTVIENLEAAKQAIADRRLTVVVGDAGREFSIAITAIEDAQMRYTRGRAMEEDKFAPADLDKA